MSLIKALEGARHIVEDDPQLAIYTIRSFEELKDWKLDELAWAMSEGAYVTRKEAYWLLGKIEEKLADEMVEVE